MASYVLILTLILSCNPFFEQLVNRIRHTNITKADSLWKMYLESLKQENRFTEHPAQIGAPDNIKDYEIRFANNEISEAEFAFFIGREFAKDAQPMESEWFLNKSESLGYICAETYLMRALNYENEWNNCLHYDEDLSDPRLSFYEKKWRENLEKFITISDDSLAIDDSRLRLTCIYWPFRTPIYVNEFAPVVIKNLEEFIDKYPKSKVIENAYERLIWWLSETRQFAKLKNVCLNFLKKYPISTIKEYMKIWLGISYLETTDTLRARQVLMAVKTDSLPQLVYPGWGKPYIIEFYENRLLNIK
ncbi:MAG: hypothetical protein ACPL28_02500 [bacterium]